MQDATEKDERRQSAEQDYANARNLALRNGLTLIQCGNKIHYQLYGPSGRWLINLYPSNQRIYHDQRKPGPYIKNIPDVWCLEDVIIAVIEQMKRDKMCGGRN